MAGNSPRFSSDPHLGPYRDRAQVVADGVKDSWVTGAPGDVAGLVDQVQIALTGEANHELRQVLFQLGAQVELWLVKAKSGAGKLEPATAEKMLAAVGRAAAIVDAFLDRAEAAKLVLRLEPASFDIGGALRDLLRWNGFLDVKPPAEVHIETCAIEADRDRLMDVLAHLAARFHFARRPGERLHVSLMSQGDHVEGFIGMAGSRIPAEELLAEFDKPLRIDEMAIDIPYTRAVIERHGGTLYVAATPEGASGFGFTLPTRFHPVFSPGVTP